MTTDLTRWLDELDAAREKATPGPWEQDIYEVLAPHHRLVAETGWRPDAALIVAAVNALPELIRLARERYAMLDRVEAPDQAARQEWTNTANFGRALAEDRMRRGVLTAREIGDALDEAWMQGWLAARAAITDAAGGGQP